MKFIAYLLVTPVFLKTRRGRRSNKFFTTRNNNPNEPTLFRK